LTIRSPSRCVPRILGWRGQEALIESPAEHPARARADELATWVSTPVASPNNRDRFVEADSFAVSVSALLRAVYPSTLT
jgi:hypothetical protein